MSASTPQALIAIGGGVADVSAATFTARRGLDTLVVGSDESILRHNAHRTGFPTGIDGHHLLEQRARKGAEGTSTAVTHGERSDAGCVVGTDTCTDSQRTVRDRPGGA